MTIDRAFVVVLFMICGLMTLMSLNCYAWIWFHPDDTEHCGASVRNDILKFIKELGEITLAFLAGKGVKE